MQQKTRGAKRRKYDASFKEEVLKMIHNGRSASEVAQSLGIGENLIYKWKSRSSQQPAAVGKGNSPIVPGMEDQKQQALLKRIRELEQERDILKKALGIFSRQT
jgi:transposase